MYTIVSLIVLLLSWLLFSKVAGSLKPSKLNLVSFVFYYQLLICSFIGSVLIINDWNANHLTSLLSDSSQLYGWLSVQYTMLAMPLGMVFITRLYSLNSITRLFESYLQEQIIPNASDTTKYPLYFLSLISIAACIYTYIKLKLGIQEIPIFYVLQGVDPKTSSLLRQEAARGIQASTTIKNYFGIILTPLLSYIAYTYWMVTKKIEYLLWFLIMFIATFFILFYDLQKSPFVFFLSSLIFVHVLIYGHIKIRNIFVVGIIAFILIFLIYLYVSPYDDKIFLIEVILKRIFLGQIAGTFFSFEYFPHLYNHLGFSSCLAFYRSLLGFDVSEPASRLIIAAYDPVNFKLGLSGVMNSLFISEAWANFGLIGVIIAPFWVGMYLQILYLLFLRSKKTPVTVGLLTYFSYKFTITNGFNEFIFNENHLFILLIFLFIHFTSEIIKYSSKGVETFSS